MEKASLKKIIVINPFGIGDILFTTPVVRALKENYPGIMIGYWCNERVADIFKNNPHIDKLYALSRGDIKRIYDTSPLKGIVKTLGLLRSIKKENFTATLDYSLDYRYSLLAKLLGIKKRVGFDYNNRGRFLTDKFPLQGYSQKHVVEYYLDLLRLWGIEPKNKSLELFLSEAQKMRATYMLAKVGVHRDDLLVGIVPAAGASWGKDASGKQWPAARFAQLADKIIELLKAKVVILGEESEMPVIDAMVYAMKNKAINLAGKTNLEELSALISQLRLMVANDGGPLHMAVAQGVATVSIFGPVDEKVYGPYPDSNRHIVIKAGLDCRPCYKNFRLPVCDRERQCLTLLDTDEVFASVRSLL